MKPILSICIPTYNRAKYLDKTLESIVNQSAFLNTDDVEIVIADNCSEDDTESVVKKYTDVFPTKIIYHKNEANIGGDKNFKNVLSFAGGTFAKLHNDNLLIKTDALSTIVEIIKSNIEEKPIIFFVNGNIRTQEQITVCKNLNEFVSNVSYFSTWIGGFGIWQDDFKKLPDFSRYYELKLTQTDVLFRLLNMGKKAVVCNVNYFTGLAPENKGDYNIAEIFGQNYLFLHKEYLNSGLLDKEIFQNEKKRLLFQHIIPYYFDFANNYNFKKTGFCCFLKDYKDDSFFYEAIEFLMSQYSPEQLNSEFLNYSKERNSDAN